LGQELAKKVLITGEQGFIGSHLLRASTDFETIGANLNILDWNQVCARLTEVKPAVILHLAGQSLPAQCDQDPAQAMQANVAGTSLLLEAIQKSKLPIHFIFASTAQVYRPLEKGKESPITETHAREPINLYARTKYLAELAVETYAQKCGIKSTILRFFNHVHCSQKQGTFLSSLYAEMLRQKESGQTHFEIPVGNLDLYRDMGSIRDLLGALTSVIDHAEKFSPFDTFNICNGIPRHLQSLAEELARQLGVNCRFVLDPSRIRENDPHRVVGSHEKLTQKIGWRPSVKTDADLISAFLKTME
jgi:nucleoside-diphosphate-sugar epimerase